MEAARGSGGGWRRAAALLLVTLLVSVAEPLTLVALSFAVLAVTVPPRPGRSVALGLAVAALFLTGGGGGSGWLVDRGWALVVGAAFAAVTLFRPRAAFFPRALAAVTAAFGVSAAVVGLAPGGWETVDWLVGSRLREGASAALEAIRLVRGEALPTSLVMTVYEASDVQRLLFPAMLGLASVAALGVAWWLWERLSRGRDDGLGRLADFRFNDQLVWIVVAGIALVVVPGAGSWDRAGENALAFMGALYAARGAAVVLSLTGGLTVLGGLLVAAGLLFLAPFVLSGAFLIGLSDTWFDLRRRLREASTE